MGKLSRISTLEFLNLNGNLLDDLNSAQIPADLQTLLLKNNHLQKSSVRHFQLSRLQELDLSFNHLTDLQNHTFQHFTHLKTLNLRSNNIQLIDTLSLADLHLLKTLDL